MFGRRKQEQAAAEAARESERRALFEKLAQRPETVCPFLGLADDRVGYSPTTTGEHRCYAFGDPAPLSFEQQERVCLQRGYGNCPRYLRGVLVIPTEELEALRHPRPMPTAPPPPAEPHTQGRRGFGPIVAGILVVVLLVGGIGYLLTRQSPGVAIGTSSPSPTSSALASSSVTASSSSSVAPSTTATPSVIATPSLEPTPNPSEDTFDHLEVSVGPGSYTLVLLDGEGNETASRPAGFDAYSFARVIEVSSPLHSWRVEDGDYAGYSYVAGRSGPFRIRRVYLSPGGERRSVYIPDEER